MYINLKEASGVAISLICTCHTMSHLYLDPRVNVGETSKPQTFQLGWAHLTRKSNRTETEPNCQFSVSRFGFGFCIWDASVFGSVIGFALKPTRETNQTKSTPTSAQSRTVPVHLYPLPSVPPWPRPTTTQSTTPPEPNRQYRLASSTKEGSTGVQQ